MFPSLARPIPPTLSPSTAPAAGAVQSVHQPSAHALTARRGGWQVNLNALSTPAMACVLEHMLDRRNSPRGLAADDDAGDSEERRTRRIIRQVRPHPAAAPRGVSAARWRPAVARRVRARRALEDVLGEVGTAVVARPRRRVQHRAGLRSWWDGK